MSAPYDHITSYPSTTDVGVYAQYTSLTTGEVWNGSAMEAWDDLRIDEYDVPAEFFSGGRYGSHVPAELPKDDYFVRFFKRSAVDAPATLADLKLPDEWSFRWNGTTLVSVPPGTPAGDYYTSAFWDSLKGVEDVTAYSDLSNTDTRDDARIQEYIDLSDDAFTNLKWSQVGRPTPISSTEPDYAAIRLWGAEWGIGMMAKARGDLPSTISNKDVFDQMTDGWIERAETEMDKLVAKWADANPDTATDSGPGEFELIPMDSGLTPFIEENASE